ncbi:hypothetical protein BO85DRAFT_69211 [Aspergillus piperis CBS 112811]|uniref:Uncharacterized protein n=1 Tax=Aspergillus piperis CBS 112811 TaxID=1448313 RepID=A0A8G1QXV8_9EURO|nr:hypothetical protein BO85DRAFT_69211 [Aspergillus piperis CBS 112811]RAH55903.1 hypothetical protein BO85DRAFT_69211 [Aspergillus piperis CBS 112811]
MLHFVPYQAYLMICFSCYYYRAFYCCFISPTIWSGGDASDVVQAEIASGWLLVDLFLCVWTVALAKLLHWRV